MEANNFQLGLIGWPLGHSLSPAIHQAALVAARLQGSYRLYPCEPSPRGTVMVKKLLARLRSGELQGLNITIPYKSSILEYLDGLTRTARQIGAANTLYLEGSLLIGDNTDEVGFLRDLQNSGILNENMQGKAQKFALVLGAGGAARAVAWALLSKGWIVSIAARNLSQAQILCVDLHRSIQQDNTEGIRQLIKGGAGELKPIPLTVQSLAALPPMRLIVNATPLGMAPEVGACPWPDELSLPAGSAIYDLVYNPPDTLLVQRARSAGLAAACGLGMLVEQAALAFETWTRHTASREAMFEAANRQLHAGLKSAKEG